MKHLCALAMVGASLILPATAGATALGSKTVFSRGTAHSRGVAEVYRFTAAKRGPVDRLSVYVDRSSTASAVEVALYVGSASRARTRRRHCVITNLRENSWNTCSFADYVLDSRATYWLGILQPAGSTGRLRYREGRVKGAPAAYVSKHAGLTALPRRWRNGKARHGGYRPSLYAARGGGRAPGVAQVPAPLIQAPPLPPLALPLPPIPTPTPTAIPSPTPMGLPGGCAVSTPNVPDGPDPWGGCFPGPSNTGVPAGTQLTPYAGPCTITSANTTIDARVVDCSPLLVGSDASGLVIENSQINGGVIQEGGSPSFTIQDSVIDNAVSYPACSGSTSCAAGMYACGDPHNATTECGVGYRNFTVLRTEIVHTNRAAYCEMNCLIKDSYFHATNLWPDQSNAVHASSTRVEQQTTLTHDSLGCDYQGPFPNGDLGCSADISGYPDFAPINHNTIANNLLLANNAGIGFCAYGGDTSGKPFSGEATNATYVTFRDNIFQRGANGKCGAYGAITGFASDRTGNVWQNNRWDNGAVVNPED